jgi:hypothetical protein
LLVVVVDNLVRDTQDLATIYVRTVLASQVRVVLEQRVHWDPELGRYVIASLIGAAGNNVSGCAILAFTTKAEVLARIKIVTILVDDSLVHKCKLKGGDTVPGRYGVAGITRVNCPIASAGRGILVKGGITAFGSKAEDLARIEIGTSIVDLWVQVSNLGDRDTVLGSYLVAGITRDNSHTASTVTGAGLEKGSSGNRNLEAGFKNIHVRSLKSRRFTDEWVSAAQL